MKKLLALLVLLLFACEVDPVQTYPFDPNQPFQIQVDVIPMENVVIRSSILSGMIQETNGDYFNRYDININFSLKESQPYPEELKNKPLLFIPPKISDTKFKMTMYVLPYELMEPGTAGYAIASNNTFVVSESYLLGTTVPHEIGHVLFLRHYPEWENVMFPIGQAGRTGTPKNFLEQQVDTMEYSLETNERLSIELNGIIIN